MAEELALSSKFERLSWRKAAAFDASRLPDPQGRRQLMKIVQASRAALPDDKFSEVRHSFINVTRTRHTPCLLVENLQRYTTIIGY
jgi:hypothetical protein